LPIIVIAQITHIKITIILFINGNNVLLTAFNFDLNINSFSNIIFIKLVVRLRNIKIINTEVALSTITSIYFGVIAKKKNV
jgi:hypothetical protein